MNTGLISRRKYVFAASVLLAALGLSACGPSATNTTKQNSSANATTETNVNKAIAGPTCNAGIDKNITDSMKAGIKADNDLYSRKLHFNFYVYGCTVYLTGYLDDIKYFKKLYSLAYKNSDVQKIDIERLWLTSGDVSKPVGGACPEGGTQCGDICIPPGQSCNMNF